MVCSSKTKVKLWRKTWWWMTRNRGRYLQVFYAAMFFSLFLFYSSLVQSHHQISLSKSYLLLRQDNTVSEVEVTRNETTLPERDVSPNDSIGLHSAWPPLKNVLCAQCKTCPEIISTCSGWGVFKKDLFTMEGMKVERLHLLVRLIWIRYNFKEAKALFYIFLFRQLRWGFIEIWTGQKRKWRRFGTRVYNNVY